MARVPWNGKTVDVDFFLWSFVQITGSGNYKHPVFIKTI